MKDKEIEESLKEMNQLIGSALDDAFTKEPELLNDFYFENISEDEFEAMNDDSIDTLIYFFHQLYFIDQKIDDITNTITYLENGMYDAFTITLIILYNSLFVPLNIINKEHPGLNRNISIPISAPISAALAIIASTFHLTEINELKVIDCDDEVINVNDEIANMTSLSFRLMNKCKIFINGEEFIVLTKPVKQVDSKKGFAYCTKANGYSLEEYEKEISYKEINENMEENLDNVFQMLGFYD